MWAREHLVLVLPGIGGSVLAPPGRPDEPVWSGGVRSAGDILRRPEVLDIGVPLEPVGLIPTRKLFGVWTVIPGYDGLLDRLGGLPGASVDDGTPVGRDLQATVVAVPYDFRCSIADAAQRLDDVARERLAMLWPGPGKEAKRIIIVAHSMGGLVARYWLAAAANARLCRTLVTLGTPHGGAPKALDVLANGVRVGRFLRFRRPVPVLRAWPGAAELLPQIPTIVDTTEPSQATRNRYPADLPIGWLSPAAAAAREVHRTIQDGWGGLDERPQVIPRIGYGHGTLRSCTWDGRRIRVGRAAPGIDGLGGWADDRGDGTVPAYCGLPLELGGQIPQGFLVERRHGPIVELEDIVRIVDSAESHPTLPFPTLGEERPVALGIDVDPVVPTRTPIEVVARFVGVDADVSTVTPWASVLDGDARPIQHAALTFDAADRSFIGELAGLPAGQFRLRVVAESVPQAGDRSVEETIEVLDEATLDDTVDERAGA